VTDPDGDDITVDGTIKLCEDLSVNPEDVVLLAVAFELKSPRVGEWNKKGWTDGWKNVGFVPCDALPCASSTADDASVAILSLACDLRYPDCEPNWDLIQPTFNKCITIHLTSREGKANGV
jgi:hypothetical protein